MRQLGLTSATAMVVANMVGAGVFTTTGFLLADLRSPGLVVLTWAVGGMVALAGALSYGAIAREIPESGGEYLFLSRTLHPSAGFLAGWVSLLAGFSAPLAAVAIGVGAYSNLWFPQWPPKLIGTILLGGCAAIHVRSVTLGVRVQNGIVLLKVVALLGFILTGLSGLDFHESFDWDGGGGTARPPSTGFPYGVFAVSLVWVSFSYAGWNAAVYIGSEVTQPRRNLPGSLFLGTLLVMILYVGVNGVFVFSTPSEVMAGQLEVGQIAARHLGGRVWEHGITAIIVVALATSASAMMMAGPRVYHRMASDGLLPNWWKDRGGCEASSPPRRAIFLQWAVAVGFLWSGAFEALLTYIGFTLGLSNVAVVIGMLIDFRRRQVPLGIPGGWTGPILFVGATVLAIGMAFQQKPVECLWGSLTLVLGLGFYRLVDGRNKGRPSVG